MTLKSDLKDKLLKRHDRISLNLPFSQLYGHKSNLHLSKELYGEQSCLWQDVMFNRMELHQSLVQKVK